MLPAKDLDRQGMEVACLIIEIKNDPLKGPGYARISLSARSGSLPISLGDITPQFIIESPGRGEYLSNGQWAQAENRLTPNAFYFDEGRLILEVGPEVVDNLEALENYRFTLILPEFEKSGALVCNQLMPSPIRSGHTQFGRFETPPEQEAPKPETMQASSVTPEPEVRPLIQELASTIPFPEQSVSAPTSNLQIPDNPPADYISLPPELDSTSPTNSKLPLLISLGLIILIAVVGTLTLMLRLIYETNVPIEMAASNLEEPAPADPKTTILAEPEPVESTPKLSPVEPGQTANLEALQMARGLLRDSPGDDDIRRALTLLPLDENNADANFLLREELAQRGDAESMFLLGQFYDPNLTAPTGSIEKDPAQAVYWYAKAKKNGWQSAGPALEQLKTRLQTAAAEGDSEAQRLLDSME